MKTSSSSLRGAPVAHRGTARRGLRSTGRQSITPQAFFNFFGGGDKKEKIVYETVEDASLPFPRSLVSGTFIKNRPLALAYRASRDGWSAKDFHGKVDFKGPAIVVGVTSDNVRFGGFNPVGYESSDDYKGALNAFLFCWPSGTKNPGKEDPIILKKVGGGEAAIYDYRRGGPQFGSDGLLIGPPLSPVFGGFAGPDNPNSGVGDLRSAKSRLGLTYAKIPDSYKQASLFGGSKTEARLKELEVYFAPELAQMY